MKAKTPRIRNIKIVPLLVSMAPVEWGPVDVRETVIHQIMTDNSYNMLKKIAINLGIDEHVTKQSLAICVHLKKNIFFIDELGHYTRRTLVHFITEFKLETTSKLEKMNKKQLRVIVATAWKGGQDQFEPTIVHTSHIGDLIKGIEDKFCSEKAKKLLRTPGKDTGISLHEHIHQLMATSLATAQSWKRATSPTMKRDIHTLLVQQQAELDKTAQQYLLLIQKHCRGSHPQCDKNQIPEALKQWATTSPLQEKSIVCSVKVHGKKVTFRQGDILTNGFIVDHVVHVTVDDGGSPITWLGVGKPIQQGSSKPSIVTDIQNSASRNPIPDPIRMSNMFDLYDQVQISAKSFINVDEPVSAKVDDTYKSKLKKVAKKAIVEGGARKAAIFIAMTTVGYQMAARDLFPTDLFFRSYANSNTVKMMASPVPTPMLGDVGPVYEATQPPDFKPLPTTGDQNATTIELDQNATTIELDQNTATIKLDQNTTTNPFLSTNVTRADNTNVSPPGSTIKLDQNTTTNPFFSTNVTRADNTNVSPPGSAMFCPVLEVLTNVTTSDLPVVSVISALPWSSNLGQCKWVWFSELLYKTTCPLPQSMIDDALQLQHDSISPVCVDISDLLETNSELQSEVDSGKISAWTTSTPFPVIGDSHQVNVDRIPKNLRLLDPGVLVVYFSKMRKYMTSTVHIYTWLIDELQNVAPAINSLTLNDDIVTLVSAINFQWNILSMSENTPESELDVYRFVNVRPLFMNLQRILFTLHTRKGADSHFDRRDRLSGTVQKLMTYLLQIGSRLDSTVQPEQVPMMATVVTAGYSAADIFTNLPLDDQVVTSAFEDLRRHTTDIRFLQDFWSTLSQIKTFRNTRVPAAYTKSQLVPFAATLGEMTTQLEHEKLDRSTTRWLKRIRHEGRKILKAQLKMGGGSPTTMMGYYKMIKTNVNTFRIVLTQIVINSRKQNGSDIVDRIGHLLVSLQKTPIGHDRKVMGTLQLMFFLLSDLRNPVSSAVNQVDTLQVEIFPDLEVWMQVTTGSTIIQQWVSENIQTLNALSTLTGTEATYIDEEKWVADLSRTIVS